MYDVASNIKYVHKCNSCFKVIICYKGDDHVHYYTYGLHIVTAWNASQTYRQTL